MGSPHSQCPAPCRAGRRLPECPAPTPRGPAVSHELGAGGLRAPLTGGGPGVRPARRRGGPDARPGRARRRRFLLEARRAERPPAAAGAEERGDPRREERGWGPRYLAPAALPRARGHRPPPQPPLFGLERRSLSAADRGRCGALPCPAGPALRLSALGSLRLPDPRGFGNLRERLGRGKRRPREGEPPLPSRPRPLDAPTAPLGAAQRLPRVGSCATKLWRHERCHGVLDVSEDSDLPRPCVLPPTPTETIGTPSLWHQ